MNKTSRITSLDWGDKDEILIGRANKFVKIYDASSSDFTTNVEMIDGPIVGLARFDGKLIAGIENGTIQVLSNSMTVLKTGDHMSKMSQCKQNKKLIATGGKDRQNKLKVFDLETQKLVFESKNLKHDSLQLEVPIWDTSMSFVNEHMLATCSRYGYIRCFDTKQQKRRPTLEYTNSKEQIAYTCLTTHGNMLYAGTTSGIVRAFDTRSLHKIVHTYKGFTGSISDIGVDESGNFLFSASLDRFVRVHATHAPSLLYQCYVKSKATKILLRDCNAPLNDSDCQFLGEVDDEDDDEEIDNENITVDNNQTNNSDSEYDDLFNKMDTVGLDTDFFNF